MRRGAFTRRDWMGLGALGAGALVLGRWVGESREVGRDVSDTLEVASLLDAPGFPAEGRTGAPVTMLVFSDYACSVCRAVEPEWRAAVAEAGDVRVVHRDWPILGPASVRAARVVLASAMQGLYAPVHATLMRTGRHGEDALRAAVSAAGGDWARIERDLATGSPTIDRLLSATAQDALQLGFRGTPGYLIGPIRIEGGATERQFAQAIRRARTSGR